MGTCIPLGGEYSIHLKYRDAIPIIFFLDTTYDDLSSSYQWHVNVLRTGTHVATSPGDDVSPKPIQTAQRPSEGNPRGSQQDRLSADGKHVFVLNTPQGSRPDACAHDNGVGPTQRCERAIYCLRYVLNESALDSSAAGKEAGKQVIEINRAVDRDRRERYSTF